MVLMRAVRVLVEALIFVLFLGPLYEKLRNNNPQLNLPKADSLVGVFLITLLVDLVVVG